MGCKSCFMFLTATTAMPGCSICNRMTCVCEKKARFFGSSFLGPVLRAWSRSSGPLVLMPLRSEAGADEANFCHFVCVIQLFLKERPVNVFGLQKMEDVFECTRNALFWCYCHLGPFRADFGWQIEIAIDVMTTLRYGDPSTYPECRIVGGLPDTTEGIKVPLTRFTKRDFYMATLFISYLDAMTLDYKNFRWSTFRENLWEAFNKAVQHSELDDDLRIGNFGGSWWEFELKEGNVE